MKIGKTYLKTTFIEIYIQGLSMLYKREVTSIRFDSKLNVFPCWLKFLVIIFFKHLPSYIQKYFLLGSGQISRMTLKAEHVKNRGIPRNSYMSDPAATGNQTHKSSWSVLGSPLSSPFMISRG